MTNRRFSRRKQSGSLTFKAGVMICVWLSVVVLCVPLAALGVRVAKEKVHELALAMGYVDPNTCVVTEAYAIDCTEGAAGVVLKDAFPKFQATLADEQGKRADVENDLAVAKAAVLRMKTMLANQQPAQPYSAATLKPTAPEAGVSDLGAKTVEVKRAVNGDSHSEPATDNAPAPVSPEPFVGDDAYVPADQESQ